MHSQRTLFLVLVFSLFSIVPASGVAQPVKTPDASPKATVSQAIGLSEISIVYHSPGVKGRKVWGALVPFDGGKPLPWRAGANENTTIAFTHDVKIAGKDLPAGIYGLHMIPSENDWIMIFSRNHLSWGSFFYREDEDALRVMVKPVAAEHLEWLMYGFENLEPFAATAYLRWEKLKVPFRIEIAGGHNTVLASLRQELRSLPGFFSQGFQTAAEYCAQNNINHEEGLQWANRAIALGGGFNAIMVKSQLLAQIGKATEAAEVRKAALDAGTEIELNNHGYQLSNQGKIKEAVEVFAMNVKKHPDSWNAYDSLGEGYEKNGDTAAAIRSYKRALDHNPPKDQVDRINQVLKTLQGK